MRRLVLDQNRMRRAALVAMGCMFVGVLALASPQTFSTTFASAWRPLWITWYDFCSMLMGAAPFITAGALAAAALECDRVTRSRYGRFLVPVVAMVFPGCDCTMNGLADGLRRAHPRLAAFATVWGSCCNPTALVCTAAVLGPRLLEARIFAGCIAAGLTALACQPPDKRQSAHACNAARFDYTTRALRAAASGLSSFAWVAMVSACVVGFAHGRAVVSSRLAAIMLGALLSPCSSADAIIARILTTDPSAQLAFILSGQCLDVRQLTLTRRVFGSAHMLWATAAALIAIAAELLWLGHTP